MVMNFKLRNISIFMLLFFLWGSCDTTFEPMQENDRYAFSMAGALDVHADTQWVRVMPVGTELYPTDNQPSENIVRLIDEQTGQISVMNDSLFRFGGTSFVRNYWLPGELIPEHEYRIEAETPEGWQSEVLIVTPPELPVLDIDYSLKLEEGKVIGTANAPIVTAEFRYLVQPITMYGCGPETEVIISHTDEVVHNENGSFELDFRNTMELSSRLDTTLDGLIINSRKFVFVTAGEHWPDIDSLDEIERTLPDAVSNVENGTGFVAGIASRTIQVSPRQPPC